MAKQSDAQKRKERERKKATLKRQKERKAADRAGVAAGGSAAGASRSALLSTRSHPIGTTSNADGREEEDAEFIIPDVPFNEGRLIHHFNRILCIDFLHA